MAIAKDIHKLQPPPVHSLSELVLGTDLFSSPISYTKRSDTQGSSILSLRILHPQVTPWIMTVLCMNVWLDSSSSCTSGANGGGCPRHLCGLSNGATLDDTILGQRLQLRSRPALAVNVHEAATHRRRCCRDAWYLFEISARC